MQSLPQKYCRFSSCSFAALLILSVVGGCNRGASDYPVPVQGTVTLDSKPLAEGKISFITIGQVPETVDIIEGKYNGKVRFGTKRVEIAAYRPVQIPPGIPESMHALMKPGKENYLPEIYQAKSTLSRDIQKVGPNTFNFELSSQ